MAHALVGRGGKAFELAGPQLRPMSRQHQSGGAILVKSVRPENTDPIPLRSVPPKMGTIMIRLAGLLVVAAIVLALIWSR
jgi:hypothetical protein